MMRAIDEARSHIDVGHDDASAGFQYAHHLVQGPLGVLEMNEYTVGTGSVEAAVWELKFVRIALNEFDGETAARRALAALLDHRRAAIQPDHLPVRTHEPGDLAGVVAGATSDVKYAGSRVNRQHGYLELLDLAFPLDARAGVQELDKKGSVASVVDAGELGRVYAFCHGGLRKKKMCSDLDN
jgi:hypothetical protein